MLHINEPKQFEHISVCKSISAKNHTIWIHFITEEKDDPRNLTVEWELHSLKLPRRNKGLKSRPYEGKPMVTKPFIALHNAVRISGGYVRRGGGG